MIDACFSGSFFNYPKGGSKESLGSDKPSRFGISASRSEEEAKDGEPGKNSPFASALIKVLTENTEHLTATRLAVDIGENVKRVTENKQNPHFERLDVKGDKQGHFVFIPNENENKASYWGTLGASVLQRILAFFPNGQYADDARKELAIKKEEAQIWEDTRNENTIKAYYSYIEKCPDGKHTQTARDVINELEEEANWKNAKSRGTISAFLEYQQKHPEGKYAEEAKALCDELMKQIDSEQDPE